MRGSPKTWVYALVILSGFGLGWMAAEIARELGVTVGMLALGFSGTVQLADDIRRAKARRIQRAWEMCGYNLTTAARTCEMDVADFHKMVFDASRKCDLWRLAMLGVEFESTLAMLDLEALGLPRFAQMALKVAPYLSKSEAAS